MSKSVVVIGCGFVGGSLARVLNEKGVTVHCFDRDKSRVPNLNESHPLWRLQNHWSLETFVNITEADPQFSGVYFICVPTPMLPSGAADISIIEKIVDDFKRFNKPDNIERILVIKSTVPPGTTARLNETSEGKIHVIFCPEFLTEANALDDMRNQDRIILGGPRPWINEVRNVFRQAFPKVPIVKTSSTTAEMVKYVTNIHLAVKVALANEFSQICEQLDKSGKDIDYDKVVEYATLDKRLGNSHWQVPGPMPSDLTGKPALGFAGSCFIKDINALMYLARQLGVDPKVMSGAWEKNLEVRPERDWEQLKGRAVSVLEEDK